ncbi:hypothetical protein HN532_04095 [archaeon]|jgi:hypothetical protein|nr:hypothetical protein [archaeon]
MKKILTLLILPIMFISLVPVSVSADTNAGVGPNSFFYFFDTTFEKVGLFFTFDSEKKAQKALVYADERLAEAEESANSNKPKDVEKAMEGYEKKISLATEKSKELKDEERAEELLNTISENTSKHQEVLESVLEKVSDEAKEAILKAIEVSKRGQKEALKQISDLKKEVSELKQELEEVKKELESKDKESKEDDDEEIEKLQKEVEKLKQQSKSQKLETEDKEEVSETEKDELKIVTFPNGAIVEIDKNGNIIKTIKEASTVTSQTPDQPVSTTQSQDTAEIQISNVNTTVNISSVRIEWGTNIPTDSKLFLIDPDNTRGVYTSLSGLSTSHFVNIALPEGLSLTYTYEIEAIDSDNNVKKLSGSFSTTDTKAPTIISLDLQESSISYDIHIASDEEINFGKIKFYKAGVQLPIILTLTESRRSGKNSIAGYTNYYIYRGTMSKYLTELANNKSFDFLVSVPDMHSNVTDVQKHCRFFHSDENPEDFQKKNGVSLESIQDKCMF